LELTNTLLPAYMQHSGLRVKAAVESGLSPSAAYAANGMATPIAAQLLAGGERSGDLGGVLTRIARFHELEVTRRVERVMRTMEPAIMVLIGVGVGMVVVLMYMPIFELASAVQ
jgi:general secretion pathway protein F